MRRKTVKNLVTTAMVTALVLGGSTVVYAEELPVEVETEAALDEIAEAETETVMEEVTEVTEESSVEPEIETVVSEEAETEAVLENNESDSALGATDSAKLSVPLEINLKQYTGETISNGIS